MKNVERLVDGRWHERLCSRQVAQSPHSDGGITHKHRLENGVAAITFLLFPLVAGAARRTV
jgi:hypothetical protein